MAMAGKGKFGMSSSSSNKQDFTRTRKRPRADDADDDSLGEGPERVKKINKVVNDVKLEGGNEGREGSGVPPSSELPLRLKPLLNKNTGRRRLSIEVNSNASATDNAQNFKAFKKVSPILSTTSDLNTSIRGSDQSETIKLGVLTYSPGKSGHYLFDDDSEEDDQLPVTSAAKKSGGKTAPPFQIVVKRGDKKGGRKRPGPATSNPTPKKRSLFQNEGSATHPPVLFPNIEDEAVEDVWTFER